MGKLDLTDFTCFVNSKSESREKETIVDCV